MAKKIKRVQKSKRSGGFLSKNKFFRKNKNVILTVGIMILLTIIYIAFSKNPSPSEDMVQSNTSMITPSIPSTTPSTTSDFYGSKSQDSNATSPTNSPTPTPKGLKTITGHFIDENLQPFPQSELKVRIVNIHTKEEKDITAGSNFEFQLVTPPSDYDIFFPTIPGYTGYSTYKECFGNTPCNAVLDKSTTCIESECDKDPNKYKAFFRYAGQGNDEVQSVVIHDDINIELFFMYKKY